MEHKAWLVAEHLQEIVTGEYGVLVYERCCEVIYARNYEPTGYPTPNVPASHCFIEELGVHELSKCAVWNIHKYSLL